MQAEQQISADPQTLSLYQLLDPEVVAYPYPLYHRLRSEDPVHWDPFLHKWVVTRYADALIVLHHFSANCVLTPDQLQAMHLSILTPLSEVLVRQMLFMDHPAHGRIRSLASRAFTPRRVEGLRAQIQTIIDSLLDAVQDSERMDVIADLAYPLPAKVNAEMLGLPRADWKQLTRWSAVFAEVLGNFQYSPDRARHVLRHLEDMSAYFLAAVRECQKHPREGLISALVEAEVDGDHLTEEEVVANAILTMVGGQETTTNLIGNGILTLLRHPDQLEALRADLSLMPSAVEELLRYESPSQQTTRLAPEDTPLGEKLIRKGQTVMVVMGAANRDPERFPDPDRLDIRRQDNRHVAFGWASHFCFGAPLGRLEGQLALSALLSRMPNLRLEPGPLTWRENLGLRGLTALPVAF
ncbi:MAG TPA: cytochrome P450 [Ktedonobacterales bacterium]|nr:cytochrome P450 [Ktedonobacterales bacterium]